MVATFSLTAMCARLTKWPVTYPLQQTRFCLLEHLVIPNVELVDFGDVVVPQVHTTRRRTWVSRQQERTWKLCTFHLRSVQVPRLFRSGGVLFSAGFTPLANQCCAAPYCNEDPSLLEFASPSDKPVRKQRTAIKEGWPCANTRLTGSFWSRIEHVKTIRSGKAGARGGGKRGGAESSKYWPHAIV